jgi:hypothetical protein
MAFRIRRREMKRPSTIFLLACALFLRLWVPAGWMPSAAGGVFVIEPCPSGGPAPMAHAMHHGASHKDSPHRTQHQADCTFAPHHAGAPPVALAPPLAAPLLASASRDESIVAGYAPTGPPAPPPPATGPPALA